MVALEVTDEYAGGSSPFLFGIPRETARTVAWIAGIGTVAGYLSLCVVAGGWCDRLWRKGRGRPASPAMWQVNMAAGLVPVLLAGVPFCIGEGAKRHLAFDRSEWIESRGTWGHPTPRRRMVRDLVRYHLLPGLSREEVTRLLGEPSDSNREALRYSLDPEFMRGSDNYWNDLVVEFDEEGVLVGHEVERN